MISFIVPAVHPLSRRDRPRWGDHRRLRPVHAVAAHLDVFPEFSPPGGDPDEAAGLSANASRRRSRTPSRMHSPVCRVCKVCARNPFPDLGSACFLSDGSDVYRNRQVTAERLAALANSCPGNRADDHAADIFRQHSARDRRDLGEAPLRELRTLWTGLCRPHLLA